MAARDNLNPDQLKMFMSPREIGQEVTAYGDFGVNMGGLPHEQRGAKFKIHNAQESGMHDSIAKDGVKHPIALTHTPRGLETANGHHRLAVQSSVDPDRLMPVSHWDEREQSTMAMFAGDVLQQRDPTGDRS
jgi:hypothetical protein